MGKARLTDKGLALMHRYNKIRQQHGEEEAKKWCLELFEECDKIEQHKGKEEADKWFWEQLEV